ncbi:hypothetical protein RQP46_002026 [Phenoliferia psychrophenolica]
MAVPLSSARQAALNKFVETFAAPILDVLAVPHFPGLFSLVDTRPLVFHIHFDFHPEKKPRSQLTAGPGDGLNYVKKIYQRYSWSRSGIHPVNLDLDFETPLKILLHMLEAKTPLGYWTNAVL